MKSPDDAHFQQWSETPEPMKEKLDGRIILDVKDRGHSAYMWSSESADESWLSFDGELTEVRQ